MPQKQPYSVEVLHVYSDEQFNTEHAQGAVAANKLLATLPQEDVATIVLIDNYNPKQTQFDTEAFVAKAAQHTIAIDHIAYEADLTYYYDEMMSLIDTAKLRTRYERYVASRQKIPCSFLTATWYLLRLGVLTPRSGLITTHNAAEFKPATKLINILPHRFKSTEDKAMSIINRTQHRTALKDIHNIYHPALPQRQSKGVVV